MIDNMMMTETKDNDISYNETIIMMIQIMITMDDMMTQDQDKDKDKNKEDAQVE